MITGHSEGVVILRRIIRLPCSAGGTKRLWPISVICSILGNQKSHTHVQTLPFLFKGCHNLVMFCREELTGSKF